MRRTILPSVRNLLAGASCIPLHSACRARSRGPHFRIELRASELEAMVEPGKELLGTEAQRHQRGSGRRIHDERPATNIGDTDLGEPFLAGPLLEGLVDLREPLGA